MKLLFITGNMQKADEVKAILAPIEVEQRKLDIPEIQGTAEEIAREKARLACQELQQPVFVDDTSLEVHAWQGLPGPYIKEFLDKLKSQQFADMLEKFDDRTAHAVCMIVYTEPGKEPLLFRGIVEGTIIKQARGESRHPLGKNFGYDPIFVPKGHTKTFAEMSKEEKNGLSHRMKALLQFKQYLLADRSEKQT
ncbi:TPA: RdgB/HAM1 family non-canonical purine NTP pyrophosphatase [Candidatus Woesearchaeota archaeon]|nr:RdgB/HAM1 family non-canonical purine NTP pyrophosphatase [Candidatus Woesearchaeota archaeon]HII88388.1 RdgB/HAM1 family non-canonical purine NTP pyrophosphatase [Candidatus Woesearchaeota archaeon]